MPSRTISMRRSRSETAEDEDEDIVRGTHQSALSSEASSRRAPSNRDDTPSESLSEPEDAAIPRRRATNGSGNLSRPAGRGNAEQDDGPDDKFQEGAIVRVKLKDFVTYASAEFFPGPSLNMVIGPNGTGKSSLVCAICLGLGSGPKVLGRAGDVGEFVKHNCDEAWIEIELKGPTEDPKSNYVVRVRIIKDGNSREWYLNGKRTSLKAVQSLMQKLSIQIDNLCQFLPQDKVSFFAAMHPIQLLEATQRAAAPEQMLVWHEELKTYRKEQKELEIQLDEDKQHLQTLGSRQDGLRAEVEKLEEIEEITKKVALLEKTIPFIHYKNDRLEYKKFDAQKKKALAKMERLKVRVEPTLQSTTLKEKYHQHIDIVVEQRKRALQAAEKAADDTLAEIGKLDDKITEYTNKVNAQSKTQASVKAEIIASKREIKQKEDTYEKTKPKEFISSIWNEEIVSGCLNPGTCS